MIDNPVNRTIESLCMDIQLMDIDQFDWNQLSEEELLFEAVICIFSSQTQFEIAELVAARVRDEGFLELAMINNPPPYYEEQISDILSEPVLLRTADKYRKVRLRFNNRLARLLRATVERIYGEGFSFRSILSSALSAESAREILMDKVVGFGPKQTSLYMRRIGYSSNFAVLDRHVLDYMRVFRGVTTKPSTLANLASYRKIEKKFIIIANEFGYEIGCVDLALWVTMRVAKKEGMI